MACVCGSASVTVPDLLDESRMRLSNFGTGCISRCLILQILLCCTLCSKGSLQAREQTHAKSAAGSSPAPTLLVAILPVGCVCPPHNTTSSVLHKVSIFAVSSSLSCYQGNYIPLIWHTKPPPLHPLQTAQWILKPCTELLTLDKHFSYVRSVWFCLRSSLIFTASQSLIKVTILVTSSGIGCRYTSPR